MISLSKPSFFKKKSLLSCVSPLQRPTKVWICFYQASMQIKLYNMELQFSQAIPFINWKYKIMEYFFICLVLAIMYQILSSDEVEEMDRMGNFSLHSSSFFSCPNSRSLYFDVNCLIWTWTSCNVDMYPLEDALRSSG